MCKPHFHHSYWSILLVGEPRLGSIWGVGWQPTLAEYYFCGNLGGEGVQMIPDGESRKQGTALIQQPSVYSGPDIIG